MERKIDRIKELIETLDILREECPWDKKQTNQSLRNNTIEECFELCDAIDNHDSDNIKEELGDLLLHVLFYSKIGEESGEFNIGDVAKSENDKLKFRHPHIFGDVVVESVEDVLTNWEKLKKIEKGESRKRILSGVPNSIPALLKADKIQGKVAKVGFDWAEREEVLGKVEEEFTEVKEAISSGVQNDIEEELGDLLFAVVNCCRLYGVSAETALAKCNNKFTTRFNLIESMAQEQGEELSQMNIDQMNILWEAAKRTLKNTK